MVVRLHDGEVATSTVVFSEHLWTAGMALDLGYNFLAGATVVHRLCAESKTLSTPTLHFNTISIIVPNFADARSDSITSDCP